MPIVVPPFTQYQAPLVPLRGLWRTAPAEGDKFVNAEIDWGTANTSAIQFALSGNSPVALSQIAAVYVDNRRCGVDVDFLFPDSGFLLTIPAHAQGLYPVLTNALMFYVIGRDAGAGDVTIAQILNSLPPPIPLIPSQAANAASVAGIAIASGTTAIVPATISGTLNSMSLSVNVTAAGNLQLALVDGLGTALWANLYTFPAGPTNLLVNLSGMGVRFRNGIGLVQIAGGGIAGTIDVNLYYSSP